MDSLKTTTMVLSVLFIAGCGASQSPDPPPPAKTVFDPLTQQVDRARDVQKTVDQQAASAAKTIDTQERGDTPP